MSKLAITLEAIKDRSLGKTQLEDFHSTLCELLSDEKIALADVVKQRAMFEANNPDGLSDSRMKIKWKATPEGQREIELKAYVSATNTAIKGVLTRIYALL